MIRSFTSLLKNQKLTFIVHVNKHQYLVNNKNLKTLSEKSPRRILMRIPLSLKKNKKKDKLCFKLLPSLITAFYKKISNLLKNF